MERDRKQRVRQVVVFTTPNLASPHIYVISNVNFSMSLHTFEPIFHVNGSTIVNSSYTLKLKGFIGKLVVAKYRYPYLYPPEESGGYFGLEFATLPLRVKRILALMLA